MTGGHEVGGSNPLAPILLFHKCITNEDTMDNESSKERRQYERIKKSFILSYYDLTIPEIKYTITQLKNISFGGMCLRRDHYQLRRRLQEHHALRRVLSGLA